MKSKEEQQYSLYNKGNFKEAANVSSELAKSEFFSKGHAGTEFGRGVCYEEGQGVAQDFKRAAELYHKLANQGNASAQCNLGVCYEHGEGVLKDLEAAAKLYQQSANQGDKYGQYNLGRCYEDGRGVVEDLKKAAELYQLSASQGYAYAQSALGNCYQYGRGVVKDLKKAAELYQLSANQGNAIGQGALGRCYEDGRGVVEDLKKAAELYQLSANQGNAYAQYSLGVCYEDGRGVVKDLKKAAELYQLSANQGNAYAQCSLGVCYEDGRGVVKDLKKAAELYQLSANQGDAYGQFHLGNCYEHAQGVVKNLKRAARLYQLSANQGYAFAQNNLGVCYRDGRGVVKNLKRATELFQQSANQENPHGQCYLGYCYEHGEGVPKDKQRALEFYELAEKQGSAEARDLMNQLLENNPWLLRNYRAAFAAAKPAAPNLQDVKQDIKEGKEQAFSIKTSFQIDYKELNLGKKLGQGGFGVVYQGTWRHVAVAVKQLLRDLSDAAAKEFETEVQVMAKLRCPNIVTFYGYCLSPQYSIVMECMPKGSLYKVLHSNEHLDWAVRIRIAGDVACGLAFLHQEKILHRDIKSLNILLGGDYQAKLTDFGLSIIKTETRTSTATKGAAGTLAWMAPELFQRKAVYTPKSDVYSLGMTLWELVARKLPFADAGDPALIPDWVKKGEREDIPLNCPKKLATLIPACWEGDPAKRPGSDVIASYFLSQQDDFAVFAPSFLASQQAASVPKSPAASAKDFKNPGLGKK